MSENTEYTKELHENEYVNKRELLTLVKEHFDKIHKTLPLRNQQEQNAIGNLITVIESDLKKDIKALKVYEANKHE